MQQCTLRITAIVPEEAQLILSGDNHGPALIAPGTASVAIGALVAYAHLERHKGRLRATPLRSQAPADQRRVAP